MTDPAPAAVPGPVPGAGPHPSTGTDPFAPDGVVFHPVSPRLITARLLGAGIVSAVLVIGFVIPGVIVDPRFFIPAALFAVLFIWQAWLIPRQVRAMGYALADNHLLWRHGVMFRSITVTPYGRMPRPAPTPRSTGCRWPRPRTCARSCPGAARRGWPDCELRVGEPPGDRPEGQ